PTVILKNRQRKRAMGFEESRNPQEPYFHDSSSLQEGMLDHTHTVRKGKIRHGSVSTGHTFFRSSLLNFGPSGPETYRNCPNLLTCPGALSGSCWSPHRPSKDNQRTGCAESYGVN